MKYFLSLTLIILLSDIKYFISRANYISFCFFKIFHFIRLVWKAALVINIVVALTRNISIVLGHVVVQTHTSLVFLGKCAYLFRIYLGQLSKWHFLVSATITLFIACLDLRVAELTSYKLSRRFLVLFWRLILD